MNFEESNSFVEEMEKNSKRKKKVLIVLIICAIMIVVLFGMISYIKYTDSLKLKVYVNNNQVNISSTLLIEDEQDTYINVKQLAGMLDYSYQKGGYKEYTEDTNACYLKSEYEIVSMTADSNIATKYIMNHHGVSDTTQNAEESNQNEINNQLIVVDEKTGQQSINILVNSEDETAETFTIENPIKYINNELYIPFSELERLFNVELDLSTKNRIKIYSLNLLMESAPKIATDLGYSEVSNIYENLTAMIDDMLIVGNGTNYGVISLEDGHEIISLKYEKIVYMQNTKEFFVTAENSVGIVSSDGTTIIKPTAYDNITNFDEVNKLYLVEKDKKYGVVDGKGETIVYVEYDSIGISDKEEFQNENVRNFNLLFDECIPVESNGKYGIIDINGEEKLKCVYDSLGYIANSTITNNTTDSKSNTHLNEDTDEDEDEETNTTNKTNTHSSVNEYESLLTIPEDVGIKGIIVNFEGLYGIYDAKVKRLIIPCVYSKIYAKTKSGVTKYYLESDDTEIELESHLEENNLKTINTSDNEEDTIQKEIEQENQVEEIEE